MGEMIKGKRNLPWTGTCDVPQSVWEPFYWGYLWEGAWHMSYRLVFTWLLNSMQKKKIKKLCKEYSRYSLVVVCPDCLPSLEVEVLFFPVSCCCSEVLQYFHCPYRPGLSWNQSMLSSVPALSSLPVSNVYHMAGGIAVFLGWQHSSSRSSPIWELPCLNQAMQATVLSKVLPFSKIGFLPEARMFLQVLSLLMEGYQTWCGERTCHCDGSQQIWYEHWCHVLWTCSYVILSAPYGFVSSY